MKTHHESPEKPPQPVSRLGLYLPPALLAAGALGWCGFWFFSAHLAERSLATFKAQESAKGREWNCADQRIGGFPFRIELHCASVSLSATPDGRPTKLTTGALHAATQIYSPSLALADVDGPLVSETNGTVTTARWDNLRISVRFSNRLDRLSLVMVGPRVEVAQPGSDPIVSSAKAAEAHLRSDTAHPADDRAIDIALQLNEAESPIVNALLGSSDKMNFSIAGVATKVTDSPLKGWRNLLEDWRNAGGALQVESATLAKGALQINGKGIIDLDAMRRLHGKLDVSAQGLGPSIARFGGGGMTSLISPLLTRKDGTPVQWPLQVQDGRIQLGPLRTGPVLGPLY